MNKTRQRYHWFCLAAYELRQDMTKEEWAALAEWSEKFTRTRSGEISVSPGDVWPESIREIWESLK